MGSSSNTPGKEMDVGALPGCWLGDDDSTFWATCLWILLGAKIKFLWKVLYFAVSLFQQLSFYPDNITPYSNFPRIRGSLGSLTWGCGPSTLPRAHTGTRASRGSPLWEEVRVCLPHGSHGHMAPCDTLRGEKRTFTPFLSKDNNHNQLTKRDGIRLSTLHS